MANKRGDEDDDLGYSSGHGSSAGGSASGSGSGGGSSGGPGVGDTLKKLFTAGVSAAFMTEESVRSFVSEMKLPKETLNMVLQGAAKSKEQMMDRVGREIVGIISKIDFVKEASRFVEEHKFKISAEIEVTKRDAVRAQDATSTSAAATDNSSAGAPGSQVEIQIKPKT